MEKIMAYIRKNTEELTGYQQRGGLKPSVDLCNDFVMVYGIGPEMPDQVKSYKDAGYVVHLMTGVAWGQYQDYLNGEIDRYNNAMAMFQAALDDYARHYNRTHLPLGARIRYF